MANINMLKKQHEDIMNVIGNIKQIVGKGNIDEDAMNIAREINLLAGKLKIHLNTEDQFMYPDLLKTESTELKNITQDFIAEMGNISSEFMNYVDRFNSRTKILGDIIGFKRETEKILSVIEIRIDKENRLLYPLI